MKKLFIMLLVLMMVFTLFGCAGQEEEPVAGDTETPEPITIKLACTQNTEDPIYKYLVVLSERVSEAYSGEINWEFYPNGELGTLNDTMEQAVAGANIIMSQGIEWMANFAPGAAVLQAPYTWNSTDEVLAVTESDWWAEQVETVRKNGGMLLAGNWIAGVRCMMSTDFPVNTPADLKGKIFRVPGSAMYTFMATSCGASPTTLPWSDNYTSFSQGVIDIAEANIALLYSSGFAEVCDYLNLTYHIQMSTGIFCGTSYFETLPAELQDILVEKSIEVGYEMTEACREIEQGAIEKFRAAGTTIVEPDIASFQKAMSGVWEEEALNFSPDLRDTLRDILSDAGYTAAF